MGFTVRFMLGAVLILLCFCNIESSPFKRQPRQINKNVENNPSDKLQKIENEKTTQQSIVANLNEETSTPKTEISIETNKNVNNDSSLIGKLEKSENSREEIGRSIDIEKYISKEFHSKNNVYTLPVSQDTEKYINSEYDFHTTTRKYDEPTREFDFNSELTTPKSSLFDHKYKEAVESVEQKLEHIDDPHHISSESDSKENLNLEKMYEETKNNKTNADLNYISYKNFISNDTNSKNSLHKDLVLEAGTNLDFQSSFNETQIIDETDDGNGTLAKDESEISTIPNAIIPEKDMEKLESSTSKIIVTTRKNIVLTKPPTSDNSSHISILSNKIESETIKSIQASTEKNNESLLSETFTKKTPIDMNNRDSIKFAASVQISSTTSNGTTNEIKKKMEQQVQENQVIPVHVEAPRMENITTEPIMTTESQMFTEPTFSSTTVEETEVPTSTLPSNLFMTTTIGEFSTFTTTESVFTMSTSTVMPSTTEDIQTITEIPELVSNTTYAITTESTARTSKELVFPENATTMQSDGTTIITPEIATTGTMLPTITYERIETTTEVLPMTTTETIFVPVETTVVPELKHAQTDHEEHENSTDNNTISSDPDELNTLPPDDNSGTIAAITISSIGAICLILLAGLFFVMRKRQKRFNYGQRCTPVSLDDYSMDNISVCNSVRRKGLVRSSKRSYGNPAFEDPASISHPLNFPALGKFANNLEDMRTEFEDIPQITARTNELPEGCDTKNRYANVIPLPETRVFLNFIDGYPNSDYINANYVTGPKNTKGYYIACQAPMQNTVDDFWRMIWEQQCKVILMLTHLFENGVEKCVDYLPPSEVLDCHRLFGDFQVTLKKREVKDKYIISILQLKNMVSNSWREVTHFWYLGWPEKGVPSEANSLIAFLIEARSYMKSSSLDRVTNGNLANGATKNELNPVVVHCSPGTGRTGVVIACDIAIREFEQTRLVDVPRIVYKIRRDRASSVQTKEQYAFIYKVINLYASKLTGSLDSL